MTVFTFSALVSIRRSNVRPNNVTMVPIFKDIKNSKTWASPTVKYLYIQCFIGTQIALGESKSSFHKWMAEWFTWLWQQTEISDLITLISWTEGAFLMLPMFPECYHFWVLTAMRALAHAKIKISSCGWNSPVLFKLKYAWGLGAFVQKTQSAIKKPQSGENAVHILSLFKNRLFFRLSESRIYIILNLIHKFVK